MSILVSEVLLLHLRYNLMSGEKGIESIAYYSNVFLSIFNISIFLLLNCIGGICSKHSSIMYYTRYEDVLFTCIVTLKLSQLLFQQKWAEYLTESQNGLGWKRTL